MPFYSASFGLFGFQFSIYKILPLVMFVQFLSDRPKIPLHFLILIVYFVTVSAFSFVYNYQAGLFENVISLGRSELDAYLKPIMQAFLFILVFFQLITLLKNKQINHIEVISAYILASIVLVAIGYIQLIFYYVGVPWFDFWFLSDATGRGIEGGLNTHAIDRGYYRVSSLGGEPRHYSAILVLAIMLQLYLGTLKVKVRGITGKWSILSTVFLLSGMFWSFSASGLLALMAGLTVFILIAGRKKLLFLISFLIVLFLSGSDDGLISNIVWKISSLEMMLYAAPKDAFAIKAIFHTGYHLLFGYGISLSDLIAFDYYLTQETPFGRVDRYKMARPMEAIITPTSAILQIIVSGGIVGFILSINSLRCLCKRIRKKPTGVILAILSCACFGSNLIFSMGLFFTAIIIDYEKPRVPSTLEKTD